MANIIDVKRKILERLMEMDISNVSIFEIGQYVGVLRALADINEKPYMDTLTEMMANINKPKEQTPYGVGYAIGGE